MKDRYVIIKHNAKAYQKASKKAKSQILDELTGILHMNRRYLASILRNSEKIIHRKATQLW
jgi:hypothetical protein